MFSSIFESPNSILLIVQFVKLSALSDIAKAIASDGTFINLLTLRVPKSIKDIPRIYPSDVSSKFL